MNRIPLRAGALGALASFVLLFAGCAEEPTTATLMPVDAAAHQGGGHGSPGEAAELGSPIFDLAALPDGGIVFAEFTTLKALDRHGSIREILTVPTKPGSAVNGIAPIGARSFWVTSSGLDLAVGAGLWRVSNGSARLVGDVEAFEIENDPDATMGPGWKTPACEEDPVQGFSAGPQSNPYHLESLGGDMVVLADAAGNSILRGHAGGDLEVVAVLEPPTDEDGDWHVLKTLEDDTECYVQPVPTAVAAGPDHTLYVGELTGAPGPDMDGIQGEARIWRIDGDAAGASCPSSDECDLAVSGLTSVIDVDFGADGRLYVVEYDANGWFQAVVFGNAAGGAILACDVAGAAGPLTRDQCETIADGLILPGAITFDRHGTLWVVENHIGAAPSIHPVAMP
ncbi:MAG: ScyD/ScyE family protein [Longimicrobiales bacterium]|nr:ScyD/ScyE family protein [Longimicrobiales bacterium]